MATAARPGHRTLFRRSDARGRFFELVETPAGVIANADLHLVLSEDDLRDLEAVLECRRKRVADPGIQITLPLSCGIYEPDQLRYVPGDGASLPLSEF